MRVTATTEAPAETDADTIAVGRLRGRGHPARRAGALQALRARPARRSASRGSVAVDPRRRAALARGRARRARRVRRRARARRRGGRPSAARAELGARRCAGSCPTTSPTRRGGARRGHAARRLPLRPLQGGDDDDERRLERARRQRRTTTSRGRSPRAAIVAEAQNAARDLQNTPGQRHDADARSASARARARGRRRSPRRSRAATAIEARGHGRVRRAWRRAPTRSRALIIAALRRRRRASGPLLGLVGKAVTFDTRRHLDQARGEDARDEVRHVGRRRGARGRRRDRRLGLPVARRRVVGATENMPVGPRGQARATSCAR